jgi:hypothetical protein
MTALKIANVRWCMRASPGHGTWYEGVADIRLAEPRPGDPDNWTPIVEQIRCPHHHPDSQTASKCARKFALARLGDDAQAALF